MLISVSLFISSLSIAYLIGSFPTSFILAKMLLGVDIRQHGSKNVGATNVLRVVGKVPALAALVTDVLKGVLVVTIVVNFFYPYIQDVDFEFYRCLLGLVVICGHIWSVFLDFKGGKGIATTLGVMGVIAPGILALSGVIWMAVFSFTGYVSLGSIFLALSFPVFSVLMNKSIYVSLFAVIICVLACYKHKENIRRLLKGEESKTKIF